jgi:hypothetical protein
MIFFMGAILNADDRRAIMVMPQLVLFADRPSDEIPLAFAQITNQDQGNHDADLPHGPA